MIKAKIKLNIQFAPEDKDEETSKASPGIISGTISHGMLPSPRPKPKTNMSKHSTMYIGSNFSESKMGIKKANTAMVTWADIRSDFRPYLSIRAIDTNVETRFIIDIRSVSLMATSGS